MVLIQGSNDWRLEVKIDYQSGEQITQNELNDATSLEIDYKYLSFEGDDVEGTWTCSGYDVYSDGSPYIYYNATSEDVVPADANRLVGRAIITDQDGLISKGTKFEIQCRPSEL